MPEQLKRAMILAAGLGTRMGSLTNDRPKALVEVLGKALIDYAIDRFKALSVTQIIVNLHYKADMLKAHLEGRTDVRIHFSDERNELMDTGGGVAKALPFFEDQPFFTHNSDSIWFESGVQNLLRLARAWQSDTMDALMLVAPVENALGYTGAGDFHLEPDGKLRCKGNENKAPFVWTGIQIIHPRLFVGCPDGPFSTNVVWNQALEQERLFGLTLDGTWIHVGTPEGVQDAEAFIQKVRTGAFN
jgi:MurNAc alpha-1-phosphate uridylyltransferase